MKTIALFGGSFDPPHVGHVAIVDALREITYIDKVVIMPTYLNPFKSHSHASSEQRFKWLKKIFKHQNDVYIDDFEIKQNKPIPTIQSVNHLLKDYEKIYVVIGADNLASLNKWSNYEELKSKVTFIVASRDDIKISDNFITLHIDEKVSSTHLRKDVELSKISQICAIEIQKFYKEL